MSFHFVLIVFVKVRGLAELVDAYGKYNRVKTSK